jgi:hypothetical protein
VERGRRDPDGTAVWLQVGEDRPAVEFGQLPRVVEWLASCRADRDCEIPIEVTIAYDPPTAATVSQDGGGRVTVNWSIDARLQAFDGRELPEGALSLVER